MEAVVAAFNQEKALVGAFSVIMNLRMHLQALAAGTVSRKKQTQDGGWGRGRQNRGGAVLIKWFFIENSSPQRGG